MSKQLELLGIPLTEQIAAVEREIKLRHRVYPNRVENRRMSQALADREIARMNAVLQTLKGLL